METKFCRYCVKDLPINDFDERFKTCRKCLEYKRANRDKHRDKQNERQRIKYEEDDDYRNHIIEQQKARNYKIVTCDVCNCSMSQAHYYRHKKTIKHQRNLEMNKVEEQ